MLSKSPALKMETVCFSETWASTYESSCHNNSEQQHRQIEMIFVVYILVISKPHFIKFTIFIMRLNASARILITNKCSYVLAFGLQVRKSTEDISEVAG
jgi:hypothetical protein